MVVTSFTTLARVKTVMETGGADPVDSSHENYINQLIVGYSAEFERYLGRKSTNQNYRQQFDVEPGQKIIALPAYPNVSVSTVINDSSREFSGSTVSASDYYVDSDNGLIQIDDTSLVPGFGVLLVNWTGGLGTNTTALVRDFPDLASACDTQVAYHFRRRETLGSTGLSQGPGNQSWEGAIDFLPSVRQTLDQRKRVNF
jgi:hypothetical protein